MFMYTCVVIPIHILCLDRQIHNLNFKKKPCCHCVNLNPCLFSLDYSLLERFSGDFSHSFHLQLSRKKLQKFDLRNLQQEKPNRSRKCSRKEKCLFFTSVVLAHLLVPPKRFMVVSAESCGVPRFSSLSPPTSYESKKAGK